MPPPPPHVLNSLAKGKKRLLEEAVFKPRPRIDIENFSVSRFKEAPRFFDSAGKPMLPPVGLQTVGVLAEELHEACCRFHPISLGQPLRNLFSVDIAAIRTNASEHVRIARVTVSSRSLAQDPPNEAEWQTAAHAWTAIVGHAQQFEWSIVAPRMHYSLTVENSPSISRNIDGLLLIGKGKDEQVWMWDFCVQHPDSNSVGSKLERCNERAREFVAGVQFEHAFLRHAVGFVVTHCVLPKDGSNAKCNSIFYAFTEFVRNHSRALEFTPLRHLSRDIWNNLVKDSSEDNYIQISDKLATALFKAGVLASDRSREPKLRLIDDLKALASRVGEKLEIGKDIYKGGNKRPIFFLATRVAKLMFGPPSK